MHTFGPRIMSTRLRVKDQRGRPLVLYVVSAYAPLASAPQAERDRYFSDLQKCCDACHKREVLLIGTDANAALGVKRSKQDRVLGNHGVHHTNIAGAGRRTSSWRGMNYAPRPRLRGIRGMD